MILQEYDWILNQSSKIKILKPVLLMHKNP